jgi:DNA mismatch repair protein MutS2
MESTKAAVPLEINLIGCRVEEATQRLDKFLDEAAVAGHREVRVVHGHGTGRLRVALRDLLAGHPHVASLRPGNPSEGGNGATVILLGG